MSEEITEPTTQTTLFIPKFRYADLKDKIEKLSRRAVRLGLPEITFQLTGNKELRDFTVSSIDDEGETHYKSHQVEAVEIEVNGISPRLDGWCFAASVDQVTEGVNVVKKSPFFEGEIPQKYRAATQECEHCHISRKRNNTFILSRANGEFKQVGRSCLKDFLGHADIHCLTNTAAIFEAFWSLCEDYSEFSGDCGRRVITHDLDDVLIITANLTRDFGFISSTKASNDLSGLSTATVERLRSVLYPSSDPKSISYSNKYSEVTPENKAQALACIEWVRSQDAASDNDYIANLAAVFTVDYVTDKRLGIACSALSAHTRHHGKLAEKQADKRLNEHFGEVGKRIELTLTPVKFIDIETAYGNSTLALFEDSEGRSFKWFTSSLPLADDEIGKPVKLKATIKNHEDYKGRKQTSISRAKIVVDKATR